MNYKVEGNIDFFAELNTALKPPSKNIKLDCSEEKCCLITHDTLEQNSITLTCGHTFNYLPLYHEIIKQKSFSNLETAYLAINQIKCPYCRTITNKLLPEINHPEVQSKRGVNYPVKYCMKLYSCNWLYLSGKKMGCKCDAGATSSEFGIFCNKHQQLHIKKVNIEKKTDIVIQNWNETHDQIYKKYKVNELKQLLKEKKKNISGNKKILVDRLVQLNNL